MPTATSIQKNCFGPLLLLAALACAPAATHAQAALPQAPLQAAALDLASQGGVPAQPGVTDLKFREFFKMPIGARGLEASAKLVALAGQRVRILGYMARQALPGAGTFILAPLPVALGDEDESLSDDLPASSVFVHFNPGVDVAHFSGLLRLTGTLSLGPFDEADGHVSTVRLELDPGVAQALAPSSTGPTIE